MAFSYLLAEFPETMFLTIFDKPIGEDPANQAIAQAKFNISHLNLNAMMN